MRRNYTGFATGSVLELADGAPTTLAAAARRLLAPQADPALPAGDGRR